MRVFPGDCTLITGVEACAAFYAVFKLKVHVSLFVQRVAFRRTDSGGAFVRATRIADVRVDLDVSPRVRSSLITKIDHAESLGDRKSFPLLIGAHNALAPFNPILTRSQYDACRLMEARIMEEAFAVGSPSMVKNCLPKSQIISGMAENICS